MAKEYQEKLSNFIQQVTKTFPKNIKLECKHFSVVPLSMQTNESA
jgi:hypothetical protein